MNVIDRVFEFGTVFRAEKSHTRRHLTEFTGLDFEMGAIQSEHDVMDVIENYFAHLIPAIKEKCKVELELLEVELADVSIVLLLPLIVILPMGKLVSKISNV